MVTADQYTQIMNGLRHIAKQQARVLALLEAGATTKTPGPISAFRSMMSKEFSKLLASNIATWMWGLVLWVVGAGGLGLLHWLARWLGFSM